MAVQELLVRLGLDDSSFSKKMQGVNKEISILDKNFDGVINEFKNFDKTQEGLAKKTEYLSNKMELLNGASKLCQEHISELSQESEELKKKMEGFSNNLQKVNKALDENGEGLRLAQEQYKQVSSSVEKLQGIEKVFEEANASLAKHNEIVNNSEKAYSGLDNNINNNKANIQKLKAENAELDAQIVRVCKSLGMNEKEILNLSNQYTKTTTKVEKISKQYDIVSRKYGENSERAKKLKAELDRYNATAERQKSILDTLPKDLQQLSKAYGDNVAKIDKLELANTNMAKSQDVLKQRIRESKAEIEKQETAYKEAQEQLKKYGVESDNLEKSLKQVKVLLAQENSALKEAGGNVKQYEDRVEALREEQKSLEQQLDKTQRAFVRKNKEIQDTEAKLAGYTSTVKKLNRELQETQIDKMFTGLNGTAQQLDSLGNALTGIGDRFRNVGQTLTYGLSLPIATFGASATNTFLGFEERIRKVNATFGGASDKMAQQFDYLSETSRKFGRETEWTAEQVGEAYEYMAMAGWDVEKSTNSMSSLLNLASIGMLDLGTATDIVTDTMTPFSDELERLGKEAEASGKEFNEAQYMVDIFAQTIRSSNTNVELMGETMKYSSSVTAQAGASFEDMATAIGVMANSGIKGSMAGTSLAQGITRLLAPTDNALGVMKEFGIQIAKNSDGGLDLEGTIKNLQVAFGKMDKETAVANAKLVFGQTALKGWLPLITQSSEEWDELANKIKNAEGATDQMMDEIEQSGSYSFKIMQSAISDFLIVVGDALAPALKDVAGKITDMATKLSNWVSEMKETNPELLSLIGKIGMMAIAIPPLTMAFGMLTGGMGRLFTGTSTAIKGFTNFAKDTQMVIRGVQKTDGKVGLLAKGLGTLVTKFGAVSVGVGVGVTALTGLAVAIGGNENALSWLQDKWGEFGEAVGGVCEFLNGIFQLTFGNLGHLVMGVGKSIGAILTGKFFELDDIWSETWAKMENTTAEAWSDIKMDSTEAIREIRNASEEDLARVKDTYNEMYKSLSNLTVDTADDVAKGIAGIVSNSNKGVLDMMRGTSDTMAVLLEGIDISMNQTQVTKKLEKNLESMAKSGKYSASEIKKDFNEAFKLIEKNATTGATRVKGEVTKITGAISDLAKNGVAETSENITKIVEKMDESTFSVLKSLGGKWQELFADVEFGSKDMNSKILVNLEKMGTDSESIINSLNEELKTGFKETSETISDTVNETTTEVQGSLQATSDAFGTMVATIKDSSGKGISEVAEIFATGLGTLDAQTISSLRNTSDVWYSILDGTVDSSGNLVENFSQQILWNLGWVAQQTPEKLSGFKDGLLQALIDANLITDGEMQTLVETIDSATQLAVEETATAGEEIKENITPEGTSEAVSQALQEVNTTISEQTQGIVDASKVAGEKAQKEFDEKVSGIGKDIQIDETIINTEMLGTQFQNAGTLAMQSFVTGWSSNIGLITEAINLGFTTASTELSVPLEVLNVAFDGVIQKAGLLNDTLNFTIEKINQVNEVGFSRLEGGIDNVKTSIGEVNVSVMDTTNKVVTLAETSVGAMSKGFSDANSKVKELKNSTKSATDEVKKLSNSSLTKLTNQTETFKEKVDKAKDSSKKLLEEIERIISKSFNSLINQLDSINSRLNNGSTYAIIFKSKLEDINKVAFGNVINGLSKVNSWLSTIKNNANNATYAIRTVSTQRPRTLVENDMATLGQEYFDAITARNGFDMTKYQTRGSYYSSQSMAGTGRQAMEMKSQKQQMELMKQQNELLKQLLLATMNVAGDVHVSLDLDGREIARSSARYMESEINKISRRKNRIGGLAY